MDVSPNSSKLDIIKSNLEIKSKISESSKGNLTSLLKDCKNIAINCTDFKNFDGKLDVGLLKTGGTALLWLASVPTGLFIPLVALHAGNALYKAVVKSDYHKEGATTPKKTTSETSGNAEKIERFNTIKEKYDKPLATIGTQKQAKDLNKDSNDLTRLIKSKDVPNYIKSKATELKKEIDKRYIIVAKSIMNDSLVSEDRPEDGVVAIKLDSNQVSNLKLQHNNRDQSPRLNDLASIFKAKAPVISINIKIDQAQSGNKMSTNKNDASWNSSQNAIKVYDDQNGAKIAMASGYPVLGQEGKQTRYRDPIVDEMIVNRFDNGHVIIFSGADGSGASESVYKTAEAANNGFMDHAVEHLSKNGIKNGGDLAEMAVNAIAAGQKKIEDSSLDQTHPTVTTHLGIIAKKDNDGNVSGVVTSVGDMKAFILKKDGSVVEITKGNRGSSTDVNDPGGQLGGAIGLKGEAKEDYRNLSLFFFEAKEGDVLLPMSDGIHDNLDPSNMGHLTPQSAIQEMIDAHFEGAEQLKVPESFKQEGPDLENLKNMYMKFKIAEINQNKGTLSIAEALTDHAFKNSANLRQMAAENNGNLIIEEYDNDRKKYTGKLDHISCGEIKL